MNSALYKVLVIEDEVPARDLLRKFLEDWPQFEVGGIARTGSQAIDLLKKEKFDLMFLDINLPEKTGLQVLEEIGENLPVLVFTTAYREHTLKAFEVGACDYLLKPYTKERFSACMERALHHLQLKSISNSRPSGEPDPVFVFRDGGLIHRVLYADLYYLTANGKRSVLHTKDGDYETAKLLGDLEKELPKTDFLRIHRKHMVNRNLVSAAKSQAGGAYTIYLKDEDETNLPVGREFVDGVKGLFGK
ncbi:LytR/AlgR family response regulator transcription factor [Leptospira saintgironsiae]|uniref:DNA-binding response regulator n=1 Tax=Leptospira saintgironsiae TaxID=2023183 RepID=A0A2M9YBW3_9LEPT|nr:LytTR family DNA-binding domain-containing protein [Leptospira saintgironsiae]PJZ49045.1 DNA-binding response regulator [Leptospira saintgironsiae]